MLAAAKVLNNGELIGSTPDNATAPITYTLTVSSRVPGAGTVVTTINSSTFFEVVSSEIFDGTAILTLSPGNKKVYLPAGDAAAFVTALKQAKSKVDAELRSAATVAAPAPAPAPAPKTTAKPATTSAPTTTAAPAPAPKTTAKPATTSAPTTTAAPAPATVKNATAKTVAAAAATTAATIVVTAPKKAVANTVDVPLKIAEPTKPLVPDVAPYSQGSAKGLQGATTQAQSTATEQDNAQFQSREDWRVRLALANDANYLYRAPNPGILAPLATTDGVVFPYTPLISVNYSANYDQSTLVHSNYKVYQYSGSSVDTFTITCDFTAQDTAEANYMLATIHFFKAMTKMFYGQDSDPKNGTPPPMAFIFGLGGFQFDAHPLAISAFTYNLPNDVDYIRTTTNLSSVGKPGATVSGNSRLPIGVTYGGNPTPTQFNSDGGGVGPTYVPTKISITITCIPLQSRNAISNRFSLKDYATGKLLLGTKNAGGGMW